MLTKLLDWVVGKEPVATGTGLAALVTAALGVAAAFGLSITTAQIAAIGALAAAAAGLFARRQVTPVTTPALRRIDRESPPPPPDPRGSVPLALVILVALGVALMAGMAFCGDALFEDEDEVNDVGLVLVTDHECEYGDCGQDYDQWNNRDENRNRNRNRGSFSPGPFDRSPVDAFNGNTVCLPGSTCYSDRPEDDGSSRRDDPGYTPAAQVPA
jgi:hypothetical protein